MTETTADGGDVLRCEHISKNYGALAALTDINLHLGKGEVLGLIGDNSAGKSTLLKIICGFQQPTTGTILLEGQEVRFKSVDHARSLGIDAVYQDLALIPQLTIAQNMYLNREKIKAVVQEAGLWAPHLPKEYGGMGLDFLAHAYMNEVLAYAIGAASFAA